ncbi:hypothetical protein HaLaN_23747 [Haematococcus lacustris]|uniref:Uncharacterized protein n=1 Tax=Haematococcus lacustris TaxID=44745 RepID=A0A699ZSG7_HAELA|nr:hypothetical protein HaLaN_23747 [Haematococcus lacustris]
MKSQLLNVATARLDAHHVMIKKKRKGTDKHKKGPTKKLKVLVQLQGNNDRTACCAQPGASSVTSQCGA